MTGNEDVLTRVADHSPQTQNEGLGGVAVDDLRRPLLLYEGETLGRERERGNEIVHETVRGARQCKLEERVVILCIDFSLKAKKVFDFRKVHVTSQVFG